MMLSVAQRWADLRRQGRLLLRHVLHAGGITASGRRARTESLAGLFRTVNAWIRASGVEHCIVYGTLLGWHRGGEILGHDTDVDFGAPLGAYPALLAARGFLPRGCTLHDTSHRHGGPKLYVECRGWEADIYFFSEEGGLLRTILRSEIPSDTLAFPREWMFPARPAVFLGEPTFVPANPVAYLEHLYGYIGADAVRVRSTGYFRPRHPPVGT
jgi:hypothetical protein